MSDQSDYEFITVEPPLFDVHVSDPFRVKIWDIVLEPITDLPVRVELPPILTVYPPLLDITVKITYLEEALYRGASFEDVVTAIPALEDIRISISGEDKRILEKKLKELLHVVLPGAVERVKVDIRPMIVRSIPDDLRDRYTIKIRLRRISPEIKEIIENRLTKEFRITRLVKRMEIIRDPRYIYELEVLLNVIERTLGLRGRASRPPRRAP